MSDVEEIIARAISELGGNDSDLEAEPGHFVWMEFLPESRAALTALQDAGYVVRPVEPTEAMIETGRQAYLTWEDGDEPILPVVPIYRAMVTACQEKGYAVLPVSGPVVGGNAGATDPYVPARGGAGGFAGTSGAGGGGGCLGYPDGVTVEVQTYARTAIKDLYEKTKKD